MSENPLTRPGAQAALFLAVAFTLLGVKGIMSGYAGIAGPVLEAHSGYPDLDEVALAMQQARRASPILTGVSIGNLLASILLIVAGTSILLRRPSARFWTGQALWANLLYTVASTIGEAVYNHQHAELFQRLMRVYPSPDGTPLFPELFSERSMVEVTPWIQIVSPVLVGIVLCVMYVALMRRARRSDVRAFLEEPSARET